MRGIHIHNHGLFTTIQDSGRYGFRRFGMPVSGAMDRFSLRCANLLLGNDEYAPALEATLVGPELEFLSPMHFSVTGSGFKGTLDQKNIKGWEAISASKGSRLKITSIDNGVRIYIALEGGLSSEMVLNSSSTYLPGKTGGYRGREIRKDDILPVNRPRSVILKRKKMPDRLIPSYSDEKTVRVLPGVNFNMFTGEETGTLFETVYTVTPYCDRMGLRLDGGSKLQSGKPDVISYGIHYGAIQVPGDGNPIIMGADAQTIGGYRQFANVITSDLGAVAQMKPGDRVKFEQTELDNAVSLLRESERIIKDIFK